MTGEFDVCLHGKRLSIGAAAGKELAACPSREPESGAQKREVRELIRCRLCGARGFVYACVVLVCAVTNALDFAIRPVYSAVSLTLLVLFVSPGVMWYCGCREPRGHSKMVLTHMLVLHLLALVGLLSQTDWRQTYVRLSDSVFVLVSLVYYDYSLNVAK